MSDPHADYSHDTDPPQPPGESPFGAGSPFAEYYRPPRLGIIHLLAWTAATAVLLKYSLAMDMLAEAGGDSIRPSRDLFQEVLSFVGNTAVAAALVGACILLLAKIRRLPGRFQPGHWLLLITALTSLLNLSVWGLYVAAQAAGFGDYSSLHWFLMVYGLVWVIQAGMYFYAGRASRDCRRWKVCFAVMAFLSLVRGLWYVGVFLLDSPLSSFSFPLGKLILGPVLLVVVIVDVRRGPRRDWLHGLGVAVIAISVLLWVAWWVWVTLMQTW